MEAVKAPPLPPSCFPSRPRRIFLLTREKLAPSLPAVNPEERCERRLSFPPSLLFRVIELYSILLHRNGNVRRYHRTVDNTLLCALYVCMDEVGMERRGGAVEGNIIDINSCGRNAEINIGDLNSSG